MPNSPYAASKAAADLLCRSFYETYKYPITITRCSNNYGPNQYPEKLIPLMIQKAKNGEKLPVYGNGMNINAGANTHIYIKEDNTTYVKFDGINQRVGIGIGTNQPGKELEVIEIDIDTVFEKVGIEFSWLD